MNMLRFEIDQKAIDKIPDTVRDWLISVGMPDPRQLATQRDAHAALRAATDAIHKTQEETMQTLMFTTLNRIRDAAHDDIEAARAIAALMAIVSEVEKLTPTVPRPALPIACEYIAQWMTSSVDGFRQVELLRLQYAMPPHAQDTAAAPAPPRDHPRPDADGGL